MLGETVIVVEGTDLGRRWKVVVEGGVPMTEGPCSVCNPGRVVRTGGVSG